MRAYFWIILGLSGIASSAIAQSFEPAWNPAQIQQADTFRSDQRIVGTHYFYWYDYPAMHFFDDGAHTDDALQDHFPWPESVSYNSVAWHAKQLDDCVAAGIDFIIPVYWGAVDNYFSYPNVFSIQGLGPLQRAMADRRREGKPSPKIGLFYDTSTLLPGVRGVRGRSEEYDLATAEGKDIFYRTIRDFFYQIEPQNWACIDGRPLVVLYSSAFAAHHDQSTIDYVYEQFQKDFHGRRPYVIKDNSWSFACDGITQWGAALSGPFLYDRVAQVGPGYNDSAVPGRTTPIRDREEGNFYRKGWLQVLQSPATIVLIETWSEMHEGTDICESVEYGRLYLDITREFTQLFKQGKTAADTITLKHPRLIPRPAEKEQDGKNYSQAASLSITFGSEGKSNGIFLVSGQSDGPFTPAKIQNEDAVQSPKMDRSYLYFKVADSFFFDQHQPITITYTYWDDGFANHALEYDSHDEHATIDGAYKLTPVIECRQTRRWVTQKVTIADARFVNRQNGRADFRFNIAGGSLAVSRIVITKE